MAQNDPDFSRVRVVLVETSLARNIGSTARAMMTMGLSRLVLVRPAHFPDPDAYALASGADAILDQAQVVDSLDQALAGCVLALGTSARRRELRVPECGAREAASLTWSHTQQQHEVALVFGSERVGLTNEQLLRCQYLVVIPTSATFSSLNLASAVQLIGYECRMHALAHAGTPPNAPEADEWDPPATVDAVAQMIQQMQTTLDAIGFLHGRSPVRIMRRIQRIYQRASLTSREVQILRGICTETMRALASVARSHPGA